MESSSVSHFDIVPRSTPNVCASLAVVVTPACCASRRICLRLFIPPLLVFIQPLACITQMLTARSNDAVSRMSRLSVSALSNDGVQEATKVCVTISSKVEQDTGIGFFPDLPAELRTKVENDVESRMWYMLIIPHFLQSTPLSDSSSRNS